MQSEICHICGKAYLGDGDAPCPNCWNSMQLAEGRDETIVNHPPHYTQHPSGVECIDITEHLNFCLGNVVKYLWRADGKGDQLTDLKKAKWYLEREIKRLENSARSLANDRKI